MKYLDDWIENNMAFIIVGIVFIVGIGLVLLYKYQN